MKCYFEQILIWLHVVESELLEWAPGPSPEDDGLLDGAFDLDVQDSETQSDENQDSDSGQPSKKQKRTALASIENARTTSHDHIHTSIQT